MATNEKQLLLSVNTVIQTINKATEPAVNYNQLSKVPIAFLSFDTTGTTVNKFNANTNYKNTFINNYLNFEN